MIRSYPRYIAAAHETGWGIVDRWAEEARQDGHDLISRDGLSIRDRSWVTMGDWTRDVAERTACDMSQAAGSREVRS